MDTNLPVRTQMLLARFDRAARYLPTLLDGDDATVREQVAEEMAILEGLIDGSI